MKKLLIPIILLLSFSLASATDINITVNVTAPVVPVPPPRPLVYRLSLGIPTMLTIGTLWFVIKEGFGTDLEKIVKLFVVIMVTTVFSIAMFMILV